MSPARKRLLLAAALALAAPLRAANLPPALLQPAPDHHALGETAPRLIPLDNIFHDPDVPGPAVRLVVRSGAKLRTLHLALDHAGAPELVAAFLSRLEVGHYAQTFFHQVTTGRALHGGAFRLVAENVLDPLAPLAAPLPSPRPLRRGDLALAPDGSAWFIQLADEPQTDAPVFGRLLASELALADQLAELPPIDARMTLGRAFAALPLADPLLTRENLLETSATRVPTLRFAATTDAPDLVAITPAPEGLVITPAPGRVGRATITVTATDLEGGVRSTTFGFTLRETFAAWLAAHPDATPADALDFALDQAPLPRPDGAVAFAYRDTAHAEIELQHSTDLVHWTALWRRRDGLDHPAIAARAHAAELVSLTLRPPAEPSPRHFWRILVTPSP
jgi:cyclophilin family peptidyl-prolyl cis-trans isomerase